MDPTLPHACGKAECLRMSGPIHPWDIPCSWCAWFVFKPRPVPIAASPAPLERLRGSLMLLWDAGFRQEYFLGYIWIILKNTKIQVLPHINPIDLQLPCPAECQVKWPGKGEIQPLKGILDSTRE